MRQDTTALDAYMRMCCDADKKTGLVVRELGHLERTALELLRNLQREEIELQHLQRNLQENSDRLGMWLATERRDIFDDGGDFEQPNAKEEEPPASLGDASSDLSSLAIPALRELVKKLGGSPYAGVKPKPKCTLIKEIEELRRLPWNAPNDDSDEHLFNEETFNDADASFEELDLDEEARESMFSDVDPLVPETIRDVLPEKIGTVRISGQACDVLRLSNGNLVIEQDGGESISVMSSDLVRLAERGQIRIGNRTVTSWARPSDEPAEEELFDASVKSNNETQDWLARGAISSYDEHGQFVNCFQLRNMGDAKSTEAFRLLPVRKGYRSQLESAFKRNKRVSMTGTLSNVVRYDNCIRLVLTDIAITKGAGGHLSHMSLFVSRDYKAPDVGSKLSVKGTVYAYSPACVAGKRRQLAVNAMTIKTVRK